MSILFLYASTSGSTRLVIDSLARDHAAIGAQAHDIARLDAPISLAGHDLVVLATPTYGKGDWHHAWEARGAEMLSGLPVGSRVALLGLGDARCHGATFAGGIGQLATLARTCGATVVGTVPVTGYAYQASPAVEAGHFPGLVIEYRRHRHAAVAKAREWLAGLLAPDITVAA